jgi:cyanate permease
MTTETTPPSKQSYRWVMLAGIWLAYFSFGFVLGGVPPLVVYISEDLNLTRTAMGSVLGAWQLAYIGFAMPAGALIDRFGLRRSVTLGVILMGLSGILRTFAVNHLTLFLAVALFGFGGPFVSIGAPKLISAWFDRKDLGMAMGIYMTAPSAGRILALAMANGVLMPLYGGSWRLTLATYGGIAILTGVIWLIVAREAVVSDGTPQKSETDSPGILSVFLNLLQSRLVQIILVMACGSFMFVHGFGNWLPELLRVGGMSTRQAGLWATIPVIVGLVATPIIPRLAIPSRRVPILVCSLAAASVSILIIGKATGPLLVLGLVLAGISGRGVFPVLMLVLMDSPRSGSRHMGSAGGLFFVAGEVGGVLGPLLMGVLSDVTPDFSGGIIMLAALTGFMVFLSLGLGVAVKRRL